MWAGRSGGSRKPPDRLGRLSILAHECIAHAPKIDETAFLRNLVHGMTGPSIIRRAASGWICSMALAGVWPVSQPDGHVGRLTPTVQVSSLLLGQSSVGRRCASRHDKDIRQMRSLAAKLENGQDQVWHCIF